MKNMHIKQTNTQGFNPFEGMYIFLYHKNLYTSIKSPSDDIPSSTVGNTFMFSVNTTVSFSLCVESSFVL